MNNQEILKELQSPHLHSARYNKDFEAMANHVNAKLGTSLSAAQVKEILSSVTE